MPYVPAESADARLRRYGWDVTENGCWESLRARVRGYTYTRYNGVRYGTHRLAYETWVGAVPEGHVVRHKCDNPPCINPDHLETGTQADNVQDAKSRGRVASGNNHWASKITDEEFRELVREKERGILTVRAMLEVYGLSEKAFYNRLRKVDSIVGH